MWLSVEATLISDVGKVRKSNQDNFMFSGKIIEKQCSKSNFSFSDSMSANNFFTAAVFDGMGGESYGELASFIAAREYRDFVNNELSNFRTHSEILQSLQRFYQQANKSVCAECKRKKSRMGTTASILVISENTAIISNVGDSRIYRIRNREISLLTRDHTENSFLLENNLLPSRRKGRLTQYLGIFEDEYVIEPYICIQEVLENDVYLICSDGITDMLTDNEIRQIINDRSSVQQATSNLVETALQKGGIDNISAVLCLLKKQ